MATDDQQQWRNLLEALTKRAPAPIATASVQVVREYKKQCIAALKALETKKAPTEKLQTLYHALKKYE